MVRGTKNAFLTEDHPSRYVLNPFVLENAAMDEITIVVKSNLFTLKRLFRRLPPCKCLKVAACSRGLTLIELIVVMAVLGILSTLGISSLSEYVKTAKNSACASDLRAIEKAISAYVVEKNVLPNSLADVGIDGKLDPWKRPYEYANLGIVGAVPLEDFATVVLNVDFDLYSKGEDGLSNPASGDSVNTDDIVRSNDGAFVGKRP